MADKQYRKKEHERATSDFSDSMRDLIRAQVNAHNANISDINTWINEISASVDSCEVDITDIANISTRITELSKDLASQRHRLGDEVINKMYNRIELAESNLMDTIREINAKCIIQKK